MIAEAGEFILGKVIFSLLLSLAELTLRYEIFEICLIGIFFLCFRYDVQKSFISNYVSLILQVLYQVPHYHTLQKSIIPSFKFCEKSFQQILEIFRRPDSPKKNSINTKNYGQLPLQKLA